MKNLIFASLILGLATAGLFAQVPDKPAAPTTPDVHNKATVPTTPPPPEPPAKAALKSTEDTAIKNIDDMIAKANVDKSNPQWRTRLPKPEVATFDPKSNYFVSMKTTKGDIQIKMMPGVAPMHVTSFLYLTKLGFFDGLMFHRVITAFMAQGGDPLGTGSGGPGYQFAGEFSDKVKHTKGGLLSMANAGPGTDGSQFFLTFVPTPWLDGKHTIFGEVVSGMDTLKALEAAGSQTGATKEPLKMEKVTVEVKPAP